MTGTTTPDVADEGDTLERRVRHRSEGLPRGARSARGHVTRQRCKHVKQGLTGIIRLTSAGRCDQEGASRREAIGAPRWTGVAGQPYPAGQLSGVLHPRKGRRCAERGLSVRSHARYEPDDDLSSVRHALQAREVGVFPLRWRDGLSRRFRAVIKKLF